jgi:hypothetical protein
MKILLSVTAALSLSLLSSWADNSRYVTVTSTDTNSPGTIQVLDGESAEIITTSVPWGVGNNPFCNILKNGITFVGIPRSSGGNAATQGTVVAGPATISIVPYAGPQQGTPGPVMLTVKITPQAYDVNKTLIIPPGTNQVYVALQTSTNLLFWYDATNGVYGSPDVARFFRIRMAPYP